MVFFWKASLISHIMAIQRFQLGIPYTIIMNKPDGYLWYIIMSFFLVQFIGFKMNLKFQKKIRKRVFSLYDHV